MTRMDLLGLEGTPPPKGGGGGVAELNACVNVVYAPKQPYSVLQCYEACRCRVPSRIQSQQIIVFPWSCLCLISNRRDLPLTISTTSTLPLFIYQGPRHGLRQPLIYVVRGSQI